MPKLAHQLRIRGVPETGARAPIEDGPLRRDAVSRSGRARAVPTPRAAARPRRDRARDSTRYGPSRTLGLYTRADDSTGVAEVVFESLWREPHIYLLPEYVDPRSQQEVMDEFWPHVFEAMLEGWLRDETLWPNDRTRTMFEEWLEIQM